MNHRCIWIAIFFFLITPQGFSQLELVDGIEWEYLSFNYLSGEIYDYKLSIDGDTMINNQECKILKRDFYNCNQRYQLEEYVYQTQNKFYYYELEDSSFHLLYDFDPNIGDTIEIKNWGYFQNHGASFYLKVDSIKQINFNGKILNEVFTEFGKLEGTVIEFNNYYFNYIEGIGTLINFFYFTDTGWCDGAHVTELYCYYHPNYGNLIFNPEKCSTIVPTNELDKKIQLKIFPNPATNFLFLQIENDEMDDYDVQFFTTTGQLIYQTSIQNNNQKEIDISNFPKGIYHYLVTNLDSRQRGFGKLIIP